MSNYYVLGFQSNNPKHDGAFRKLDIKTDLKDVTLRHREGYFDRRPLDIFSESKQEKFLQAAMASPQAISQIPISFRSAYFYDSPRLARVMVSAKIRTGKIELKKKSGQLVSDLRVMGVAYAEDGSVSGRFSEMLPLKIDKDKEQEFRRANIGYRNFFKLRPGKYRLKLVTADEANNSGSTEQLLDIPVFPGSGMAASSLVVAEEVSRLPDLIRDIDAGLLDDSDPLVFPGLQIQPSVENKLATGSPVPVFFKLYNHNGGFDRWKLVATASLLSEKGEVLFLPTIPLDENISRTVDEEATVGLTLPFKDISPGRYTLAIEVSHPASSQAVTVQTELEFFTRD